MLYPLQCFGLDATLNRLVVRKDAIDIEARAGSRKKIGACLNGVVFVGLSHRIIIEAASSAGFGNAMLDLRSASLHAVALTAHTVCPVDRPTPTNAFGRSVGFSRKLSSVGIHWYPDRRRPSPTILFGSPNNPLAIPLTTPVTTVDISPTAVR